MNKIPMTANGYDNLQKDLKKLLNEDRPNIIEAIAEARSHGDLSENAEYQYAKEQQSLIEGKIVDLESAVSRADVIDVKSLEGDDIKFGATVEIEDDDNGEKATYQIVGEYESDIKNNKLSGPGDLPISLPYQPIRFSFISLSDKLTKLLIL